MRFTPRRNGQKMATVRTETHINLEHLVLLLLADCQPDDGDVEAFKEQLKTRTKGQIEKDVRQHLWAKGAPAAQVCWDYYEGTHPDLYAVAEEHIKRLFNL